MYIWTHHSLLTTQCTLNTITYVRMYIWILSIHIRTCKMYDETPKMSKVTNAALILSFIIQHYNISLCIPSIICIYWHKGKKLNSECRTFTLSSIFPNCLLIIYACNHTNAIVKLVIHYSCWYTTCLLPKTWYIRI